MFGRVEDTYKLLPIQRGMIFHNLSATEGGVYIGQIVSRLSRDIDIRAFEQAWRRIVERHAVLRTSFLWEGLDEPRQRVSDHIDLSIEMQDWTNVHSEDEQRELAVYLAKDRNRGVDLNRPPLMRLALLELAGGEHLFIWTHHHALLDGRSRVIVLREVSQLYEALLAGREPDLPSTTEYRDYIDWFYTQDWSSAKQYWQRLFDGYVPSVSVVSLMRAERPTGGEKYGTCAIALSSDLKGSLLAMAQHHKVTVNIILQAVWALQMSRYAGDPDVIFGETRACRRPVFEGAPSVVGVLMSTLPMRLHVAPEKRFNRLLQDLREQHVALRKYEHTPMSDIREWSGITKTAELFESLIVFEEHDLDSALRRDQCVLWRGGIRRSIPTHYPLTIVGYNKPELSLQLLHDRELIGDSAAQRMARHLSTLLQAAANDSDAACRDLSMLDEEERRCVVSEWNQTSREFPREQVLAELFEEQVEARPDAVAMESGEQKLSYGELNRRANRWANYLISLGVGPDERVVLCAGRSMEALVAMLGILKAGGAYVPLGPTQPGARLQLLMAEIQPAAVLIESGSEEELAPGCPVLKLNSERTEAALERTPSRNPEKRANAENLAYVIYTSGSTGRPKGVAVTQRGVVRLVKGADYAELGPDEVVLQLTSLTFDVSTFEIWGSLLEGGTCVVMSESVPTARQIGRTIARHQVTTMWLTAPLFNAVVDESVEELAGVRQLLVGGEALSVKHIETARASLRGTDLINGYGPTEATCFACSYQIKAASYDPTRGIPIGKPISNTTAYVLDEAQELTPVGIEGELFIGGVGLARGYWKRPGATAERFVPNAFGEEPGSRLYKSGDRVCWREDGILEYIGRRDDQVKIRGFRIELGEINACLERHAAVHQAALLVLNDDAGSKVLTAYVVTKAKPGPSAFELRDYLRQSLPDYMVPSRFVMVDAMPLTASGKVDRKTLSRLGNTQSDVDQSYVAPRTPGEETLAGIWGDVLRKPRVGIHDNFFELGGDSLSIFRTLARVRRAFDVELPVRAVFENPSVAALLPAIEAARQTGETGPAPVVRSYSRNRPLPLSFNEEVLWLMAQFYPAYLSFNTQMAARLHGRLNFHALELSLNEIVRRHEILRTSFGAANSQPSRTIAASLTLTPLKVDLRHIPADEQDSTVRRLAIEEANVAFDLSKGPLLRVKVLELAEDESALLLTLHHIISDGWSLMLLSRELKTLYGAYSEGRAVSLPGLDIQYTDYAIWKRDWLQGEALDRLGAFWRERLKEITSPLRLPLDHPGFALPGLKEETLPFSISEEQTEALRGFARENGVTVFTILLAVFKLLLYRLAGAGDVVVAIPVDERNRAEFEGVMGLFVNLVVTHTHMNGNSSFAELLERVFQGTQESFAHQDLPFAMVEQISGNHDLGRIIFDYLNGPDLAVDLPGLETTPFSVRGDRPFATDLILFAHEKSGSIDCSFIYKKDLFYHQRMLDMAHRFVNLISQVLESPRRGIHEYESERALTTTR